MGAEGTLKTEGKRAVQIKLDTTQQLLGDWSDQVMHPTAKYPKLDGGGKTMRASAATCRDLQASLIFFDWAKDKKVFDKTLKTATLVHSR